MPRRAYLDTNLLVDTRDFLSPKHHSASICFAELIDQQVELNVSALVFDELWWGLFKVSYRQLTGRKLTGGEYKAHVDIWRDNWPAVRRITTEILDAPRLKVLEGAPTTELIRDASALIDANSLAPRDAFHLAITLRHRIPAFVTADSDFDRLQLPAGGNLTIVRF